MQALLLILLIAGTVWLPAQLAALPGPVQWLAWLSLLALWAVAIRRSNLIGPVLIYDLIRQTRRSRFFIIRLSYISGLFLLLCWRYENYWPRELSAQRIPFFIQSFFSLFLLVQILLIYFMTPALTAGAISEEKEKKTLPYLLTTELSGSEIVLSKFVSRLTAIVLVVLAGLPILSILQFLGGIDPGLLLASFAGTAVTVLSLAAVGIFFSTFLQRSRDAILMTYLIVPLYLILTGTASSLLRIEEVATFPSTDSWTSPITVQDLIYAFRAGNPFIAFDAAQGSLRGRLAGQETDLWQVLLHYVMFHGVVLVGSLLLAATGLRRSERRVASATSKRLQKPRRRWLYGGRPEIRENPVLWKEIYAEPGPRWPVIMRLVFLGAVIATFVPIISILSSPNQGGWFSLQWRINFWARAAGTLVGYLLLMGLAIRAAVSVRGEKDRHTYEALITTPLTAEEILRGKTIGALAGIGWGWLWLGSIWVIAISTGGMSFAAVPIYLVFWTVYALCIIQMGMWFSLVCKTTVKAIASTILLTVGMSIGQFLVLGCCTPFRLGEVLLKLLVGTSPPAMLAISQFAQSDRSTDFSELIGYSFFGLIVWGIVAGLFWGGNVTRFAEETGREKLIRRPEERISPEQEPQKPI